MFRFFTNSDITKQTVTSTTGADGTVEETTTTTPVGTPVEAPAFSLTKVLTTGSVVITAIATALTKLIDSDALSTGQIVTLGIGLLGFLAITASADVIGRSIAANGASAVKAATLSSAEAKLTRDTENLILFADGGLPGVVKDGDVHVQIIAATGGATGFFLTQDDSGITKWYRVDEILVYRS